MTTTTADVRPAIGSMASPGVVHWSVYAVLFASTSVLVGVLWDISWHQTIGRDSFWTPAHLAIYLGGGQMLESSGSAGKVTVSPLRRAGLQPYLARIIEY